jgi:hypothetical protein
MWLFSPKTRFLWIDILLNLRRFPVAMKHENGVSGYNIRQSSLSRRSVKITPESGFKKYGFSQVNTCQSRFAISSMQYGFVTQVANVA